METMNTAPQLIVMLTQGDQTVPNAWDIFQHCKDTKALYWGLKEAPLPLEEMKELFACMARCGKRTVLEAVTYSEEDSVRSAQMAAQCGCDLLMGTMWSDQVYHICQANGIGYMPFVGTVSGRPSVLEGTVEEMITQARENLARGACGIDLLGYRYRGDAHSLNRQLISAVPGPVCLAGSIHSYERLDQVVQAGAAFFTIGSAFFEGRFGGAFPQQVDRVWDYVQKRAGGLL